MEDDTIGIEISLVFEHSSSLLCESHQIPDILVRCDHLHLGNRLLDMDICPRLGYILRVGDIEIGTLTTTVFDEFSTGSLIECDLVSSDEETIRHLRTRDYHVHIILSPESLFDDIEMK